MQSKSNNGDTWKKINEKKKSVSLRASPATKLQLHLSMSKTKFTEK